MYHNILALFDITIRSTDQPTLPGTSSDLASQLPNLHTRTPETHVDSVSIFSKFNISKTF